MSEQKTEPVLTITPHHFWGDPEHNCNWCGQPRTHDSHMSPQYRKEQNDSDK